MGKAEGNPQRGADVRQGLGFAFSVSLDRGSWLRWAPLFSDVDGQTARVAPPSKSRSIGTRSGEL
jgi:hypothetical protein